ncbi:MAG: sulfatase [Deltaproteobacteria bacterium]|nr:sulfatase [Deltaproteobacteria bacterium]
MGAMRALLDRGPFVKLVLVLLVGLLTGLGCKGEGGRSDGPPERIILIVVDTLRRDHVSTYAPTVPTPNIDRLAKGGQVFTNATSAFHSTTMSMAALFTGRTPSLETGRREAALEWNTFASCGMSRFADSESVERCVPLSLNTLAEDLREAGYYTLGVVSNKLLFNPYGFDQGFDDWIEVGRGRPGANLTAAKAARIRTARHVNAAVAKALARRQSDRFFLYVHYIDVHDWILFGISYEESVRRLDAAVGQLIDLLETKGLLEGTAIVFTSDHGEMLTDTHLHFKTLRHYGNPSFEPLLQVPLFVNPPIDMDSNELVRSQDVRGLVRRIAGLEGGSTPDLDSDELLVTEQFYQTYRKGKWKSMWERRRDNVMLFDLASDPRELEDLADRHPEILAAHRMRVDELSVELATGRTAQQDLSPEDIERLRALGYLDGPDGDPEAQP